MPAWIDGRLYLTSDFDSNTVCHSTGDTSKMSNPPRNVEGNWQFVVWRKRRGWTRPGSTLEADL
jgi:hypothetical protein